MIFILDIDGTLVDTNYHHTLGWYRSFVQHDVEASAWRIHRHQGMGGDQLVEAVAGAKVETEKGDDMRAAEKVLYEQLMPEVRPMPGAAQLLELLQRSNHRVVLASSARAEEVDHYMDLLGRPENIEARVDGSIVEETKPQPELVLKAMEQISIAPEDDVVMIGDSVWDCRAAKNAGVKSWALLTGGFSIEELKESGAELVFEDLEDLTKHIRDHA